MNYINAKVVIHHTAFHRANESAECGKRTLTFEAPAGTSLAQFAEAAFAATNHPAGLGGLGPDMQGKHVSAEGRCYSMSTGDVAEVTTEGGEPAYFLCGGMGWDRLTAYEFWALLAEQDRAHKTHPDRHWCLDFDGVRFLEGLRGAAPSDPATVVVTVTTKGKPVETVKVRSDPLKGKDLEKVQAALKRAGEGATYGRTDVCCGREENVWKTITIYSKPAEKLFATGTIPPEKV
jgi:hypothetical protein